MKQPDKAIKLFSLNTTWYPQSANAYDSLAEAYASTGNKALAIKNYQKALELNPDSDNARAWLKKLTTPQHALVGARLARDRDSSAPPVAREACSYKMAGA